MRVLGALLLALVGYVSYSWTVYNTLRVRFWRMRILAESRPDGDKQELRDTLNLLKDRARGREPPADDADWLPVPGSAAGGKGATSDKADWLYEDGYLKVGLPEADGEPPLVLVHRTGSVAPLDLEQLPDAPRPTDIVEDVEERFQWQVALAACEAFSGTPGDLCGNWTFRFRDYVNEEELLAMAADRGVFTPFRLTGATRLEVEASEEASEGRLAATLRDQFVLLGFVPVRITWFGRLASSDDGAELELQWHDTELVLGWGDGSLSRTMQRPPAAERLRKEPWKVQSLAGSVVALYRQGVGTLAFQRAPPR